MTPKPAASTDPKALAERIIAGDRRAMARAITLIESTRSDHRNDAEVLIGRLHGHTGNSIRLGITGIPGVGKSSFIETFGGHVIDHGHRVAVLAVDPSSPRTGGSILGDKTRMETLARRPEAFIRPTPSGGNLGGVARRTREAMLICEAAGFDVIIIETVGVGQSETAVSEMVDMFTLLLAPGGGDELQGIKKGIVELADLVVVNKDDGDLAPAAERARLDYANALHLLSPASKHWTPKVLKCSSHKNIGIEKVWENVLDYRETMTAAGEIAERRAGQAKAWMWAEIRDSLIRRLKSHETVQDILPALESEVSRGLRTPTDGARHVLDAFFKK